MYKSISDSKTKALLSFDFLLNNSTHLPKSLYLKEITKNTLYDLMQNNISNIPDIYKPLPYKQLIKHLNVYMFDINPIDLELENIYMAFFDVKQNITDNAKVYKILN
jgi:hypothetical protein